MVIRLKVVAPNELIRFSCWGHYLGGFSVGLFRRMCSFVGTCIGLPSKSFIDDARARVDENGGTRITGGYANVFKQLCSRVRVEFARC